MAGQPKPKSCFISWYGLGARLKSGRRRGIDDVMITVQFSTAHHVTKGIVLSDAEVSMRLTNLTVLFYSQVLSSPPSNVRQVLMMDATNALFRLSVMRPWNDSTLDLQTTNTQQE
jgi:hypothetical protein